MNQSIQSGACGALEVTCPTSSKGQGVNILVCVNIHLCAACSVSAKGGSTGVHRIQSTDRTERSGAETSPASDQLRILLGEAQLRKRKEAQRCVSHCLLGTFLGIQHFCQWRDPQQWPMDTPSVPVQRAVHWWDLCSQMKGDIPGC